MKGKIIPLSFLHTQDSETGHQVIRMTPPHVICHRNYFYQKCFTRDGGKLIFGGAFEGHWNYYLLDIAGQQATQLTDGPGDNTFGGFLSADDRSLWYVKNNQQLRRVDLASLEEQVVYQVDDQWVAYGTWVANSDCSQMVGIEIKKSNWQPLTDWGKFRAFYFTEPECRLINIDLRSGEQRVVLQEKRWLGHRFTARLTTAPSPSAMKVRAMLSMPECGLSTLTAATCARFASTSRVRALRTNSGYRMAPRFTMSRIRKTIRIAICIAPTRQRWKIAS